ncbi:MAG: SIMPL domain-containing protein [Rhodocyclaceae bacterium]
MKRTLISLAAALPLAFAVSGTVVAADVQPSSATTIELSAEASRRAANDLATATAYFEANGADAAALSRQVNEAMAKALETAKAYSSISTSTSGVTTYPIYSKDGRRIETWRMRSELSLESRDLPALSELLGKLQDTLAVSGLAMQPSLETRATTADLAATDAIRNFEARAAAVSGTLGKRYRIRSLSVHYGGGQPPYRPMMRAAAAGYAAEAMQVPMEGGETDILVTVSGTIELTE